MNLLPSASCLKDKGSKLVILAISFCLYLICTDVPDCGSVLWMKRGEEHGSVAPGVRTQPALQCRGAVSYTAAFRGNIREGTCGFC